jgi:hypothetical protein
MDEDGSNREQLINNGQMPFWYNPHWLVLIIYLSIASGFVDAKKAFRKESFCIF